MKEIRLQIPDGKNAEWVDGVLTLVDEKDGRTVTERVKTFEDACRELGDGHPLVREYWDVTANPGITQDLEAYLRLRIITAALNEGWKPEFKKDECRWYPWFRLYTQEETDKMSEDERGRCVLRPGSHPNAYCGLACAFAYSASPYSLTYYGARLVFKSEALADYAGRQFAELWADICFIPKTKGGE